MRPVLSARSTGEITLATDIVGTVTPQAAACTGLLPGTKVLTGTGDSGAESVSCGVFTPGTIMIQLGSTCFFIYNTDRSSADAASGRALI